MERRSPKVLFRIKPGMLSAEIEGVTCCVAAASRGDEHGPFCISVIKFGADEMSVIGQIPISKDVLVFEDALTALHVGFEIIPPTDERDHSFLAKVLAQGFLEPIIPVRN